MKKSLLIIVSIVSVCLLFLGCAKQNNDATSNSAKSARDTAVVYLGTRSEPKMGFDPLKGFANVDGVSIFHSNLLILNSDLTFSNDFAKEYKISGDGLQYRFVLRDDVKCSDGKLLTAKDVKFTFENAGKSGFVGNLEDIDQIEVKGDTEIIIHLKKPNSLFIYAVARLPIVPEHAYAEGYGLIPVGSGPYKMVQWNKGQQMIVEANPYYYKGSPKLNKITVLFIAAEAALEAAKTGKIDVYDVPYNYANIRIADSKMVSYKSVGKYMITLPAVTTNAVSDPHGKAVGNNVTADKSIRQALHYVINREDMVAGLMGGYGGPAYGLVDKEAAYYNQLTDYRDNDVEKAKAILSSAGWVDTDNDGIVEKDGQKAEFILLARSTDKMLQNFAMMVSDQAKRAGIRVVVEAKSLEEIETRMHKDAWILNYGSLEPINIYYLYYGPNSGKGYYNIGFYQNSTVDRYIENAINAKNAEEANEFWKKAQWDGTTGFAAQGDAGILWLVNKHYMYQIKNGFSIGNQPSLQSGSMGWCVARNISEWGWNE